GITSGAGSGPVTTFSTKSFKGTPYGRARWPGRSNLDKGTLAAAHIGLVRAGQRPPDRRTAYGPPPLVKAAALSARECRKPDGWGARTGGTMTTRARPQRGDDAGAGLAGAAAHA